MLGVRDADGGAGLGEAVRGGAAARSLRPRARGGRGGGGRSGRPARRRRGAPDRRRADGRLVRRRAGGRSGRAAAPLAARGTRACGDRAEVGAKRGARFRRLKRLLSPEKWAPSLSGVDSVRTLTDHGPMRIVIRHDEAGQWWWTAFG